MGKTTDGGRLCFRSLPRSVRPGHQQRDVQDQKHGATGGSLFMEGKLLKKRSRGTSPGEKKQLTTPTFS